MPVDSCVLARRAAEGDLAALSELWRLHRGWLAAVILAHRHSGGDIDDLLQEVALAVVRGIRQLREPERFRPWLRAIAINTTRTAARRASAQRTARNGELASHAIGMTPSNHVSHVPRDDDSRVLAAVEALPIHYREPLLLRGVRDLTIREIAAVMDLPEKTVETRLLRARRLVAESLETSEPAPPATNRETTQLGTSIHE